MSTTLLSIPVRVSRYDGKPIPYWLYKLHGLGVEYKCEICGNFTYMGRRAFDRHFQVGRGGSGVQRLCVGYDRHFQVGREVVKSNGYLCDLPLHGWSSPIDAAADACLR